MGIKLITPQQLQQIQKNYERAAAEKRQALKEKYESNAEVQRARAIGKDSLAREAIDRSTKAIKEHNDFTAGRDTSEDAARRKAIEIASKQDRERNH